MGFEPTTASLEGWNSTTELRPPIFYPRPAAHNPVIPFSISLDSQVYKPDVVGRQGFEPWKPMATDLQSAPFGHLGTCPKHTAHSTRKKSLCPDSLPFSSNDEKRKASQSTHGSPP